MREVVIAGGGLAGAAAGAALARAGRPVLVLEREPGPRDKICGEFLSAEAQGRLKAIGLDLARLGGAPVDRLRLAAGPRSVAASLPFQALGLSRRRLDEALLGHAARLGAKVERGVSVRRIEPGALVTSRGEIKAGQILLASGKHDVRGARRRIGTPAPPMIGFKTYFQLPPRARAALEGCVEVVLFEGGYAGLQLVEGGLANLCLIVSRERFAACGRTWRALLEDLMREPHLRRRLGDADELLPRPLTITDVPYGFVQRETDEPPGLYRLGDQCAVIPSFCGEGMSIALHSATLAARMLLAGGDARAYHVRFRAEVSGQIRLAGWLQRRVDVWPGRGPVLFALGLAPWALGWLAARTRVSGADLWGEAA